MAITTNRDQKFAFLFSSSTDSRYVEDLKMVFDTLTIFYNYSKSKIWVVYGDGTTDKSYFAGAVNENLADYDSALDNFIVNANNVDYTFLLYFTGVGTNSPEYAVGPLTASEFGIKLMDVNDGMINIVMQQSYSGGFQTEVAGAGYDPYSFTSACSNGQTSKPGVIGSQFTEAWTKGLQFQPLTTGQYADELIAAIAPPEFHISLEQAKIFADTEMNDPTESPQYQATGVAFYLGKPDFLIRDGNHETLTDPVYESPDIYLTHPTGSPDPGIPDQYVQDTSTTANNIINVRVINTGTHPLRKFYVGVTRYTSGIGGGGEDRVNEVTLTGQVLCPIRRPTDATQPADALPKLFSCVSEFNDILFPDTTHRCVRAKAQLALFTPADLDTWVWDYHHLDEEAQRNIDHSGLDDSGGGGGGGGEPDGAPAAGEGNVPEEPEEIPEDAEDQEANEKMQNNLKGFKEHIYEIRNTYKEKRRFVFVFPENYKRYMRLLNFEWFEFDQKLEKNLIPIEIKERPNLHISFDLNPKESKKIMLYFALRPGKKIEEKINLPFDILVDLKEKDKKLKTLKRSLIKEFKDDFAMLGGITLKIRSESAKLHGKVVDREERPVQNAMVIIQTANRRQGAIIRTRKDGTFDFPKINPDVYRVMAVTKKWHTKDQLICVPGGKKGYESVKIDFKEEKSIPGVPVKIIIDKIKVLNDHEPFFKGKGEFLFTSVVIPDKNEKLIKVMQLPRKGLYRIQDKPGTNEINLGICVFEGTVRESLLFAVTAKETDRFDPDDKLNKFHRYFMGDPEKWYGKFKPGDENRDKEDMGDWQIWYRVVRL